MEDRYLSSFTDLDDHWWRKGRRDVITRLVDTLDLPSRTAIDVGCGSGANLEVLDSRGFEVFGVDLSVDAVGKVRDRGMNAAIGDVTAVACPDEQFGLLVASDVLEHIPDDQAALTEWYRVLQPGAFVVIFVPAFEWLWSSHDDINNHQRRYTASGLRRALETAGFDVQRTSYWNIALTPAAIPVKLLDRFRRTETPQIQETFGPLNSLFFSALRIENSVIERGVRIPFGTSVFAVARRSV